MAHHTALKYLFFCDLCPIQTLHVIVPCSASNRRTQLFKSLVMHHSTTTLEMIPKKVELQKQTVFKRQKDPPIVITRRFKMRSAATFVLAGCKLWFRFRVRWIQVTDHYTDRPSHRTILLPKSACSTLPWVGDMPTYSENNIAQFLEHCHDCYTSLTNTRKPYAFAGFESHCSR